MTHHQVAFGLTPGLAKEMQHLEREKPQIYSSLHDLNERTENTSYRGTALELHSRLSPKSSLLDVGCGFGETSLLLAQCGHNVHSIEPSLNRISALQQSAKLMQLPLHTYECTGEAIGEAQIPKMDGCLFNSSLHHCDDPLRTLSEARKTLKKNGVIVLNEPILRFYLSKKKFYRKLETHPAQMGHYGGNEHIYYFKEYYKFLKLSGFENIEFFWSNKSIDPRKTLIRDLSSRFYESDQYSVRRCLMKYSLHKTVRFLSHSSMNKILVSPLLRLSLLQATFVARANPSRSL